MKRRIIKAQWGSPSPVLTALGQRQAEGDTSDSRTAGYLAPVVGTAMSIQDAYNNPTGFNIGMAGLSLIGDIGLGLGIGQGLNNYVALQRADQAAEAARAAYEAGHAKAVAATQNAANATAKARKAKSTVDAASMSNANTQQVINLQKKANASRAQARQAVAAQMAAERDLYGGNWVSYGLNTTSHPSYSMPWLLKSQGAFVMPNYYTHETPRIVTKTPTSLQSQLNSANAALSTAIENYRGFNPYKWTLIGTSSVPHLIEYGRSKYAPEDKYGRNNYVEE